MSSVRDAPALVLPEQGNVASFGNARRDSAAEKLSRAAILREQRRGSDAALSGLSPADGGGARPAARPESLLITPTVEFAPRAQGGESSSPGVAVASPYRPGMLSAPSPGARTAGFDERAPVEVVMSKPAPVAHALELNFSAAHGRSMVAENPRRAPRTLLTVLCFLAIAIFAAAAVGLTMLVDDDADDESGAGTTDDNTKTLVLVFVINMDTQLSTWQSHLFEKGIAADLGVVADRVLVTPIASGSGEYRITVAGLTEQQTSAAIAKLDTRAEIQDVVTDTFGSEEEVQVLGIINAPTTSTAPTPSSSPPPPASITPSISTTPSPQSASASRSLGTSASVSPTRAAPSPSASESGMPLSLQHDIIMAYCGDDYGTVWDEVCDEMGLADLPTHTFDHDATDARTTPFPEGVLMSDSFESLEAARQWLWSPCNLVSPYANTCSDGTACGQWTGRRIHEDGTEDAWDASPFAVTETAHTGQFSVGVPQDKMDWCDNKRHFEIGGADADPLMLEMHADDHAKWNISFWVNHWWRPGASSQDDWDVEDAAYNPPVHPLWFYLYADYHADDIDLATAIYGWWYLFDDEFATHPTDHDDLSYLWRWKCADCECEHNCHTDEDDDEPDRFFTDSTEDMLPEGRDLSGWHQYSIVLDLEEHLLYQYMGEADPFVLRFSPDIESFDAIGFSIQHDGTSQTLIDDVVITKLPDDWSPAITPGAAAEEEEGEDSFEEEDEDDK